MKEIIMGRDYQKDHLIFLVFLRKMWYMWQYYIFSGRAEKTEPNKKVIFLFLKINNVRVLSRINIKSDRNWRWKEYFFPSLICLTFAVFSCKEIGRSKPLMKQWWTSAFIFDSQSSKTAWLEIKLQSKC